ncbi:epidermal growth factor-like protein 7 isoform X4 [Lutra lutra]|uniref:epidermal growth factor-like protein 7 isoform X4 n=1 Tax=Lutra lutra TaxID=9657 RepID=UPI001FD47445|nr:epidermal growth factor-like protein 7 isoform X4 [Lutra lutra]
MDSPQQPGSHTSPGASRPQGGLCWGPGLPLPGAAEAQSSGVGGPRRTAKALVDLCHAPRPDQHAQGRVRLEGSTRTPACRKSSCHRCPGGMTEPPSPAVGCVPSGLPGALSQSPSCSECTSPSSPPVMGTEPAAPTGPSTGLPTAAALGRLSPGPATPAARAGRGPAGSPGPVEQPPFPGCPPMAPWGPPSICDGPSPRQRYAGHRARTEGPASSQAAVTALQDGRVTPARQARTAPSRRKCRDSGHGWTSWSRSCSSCLPHCTAWPRGPWSMGSQTPAASWLTPSSSWTASTL